MLEETVKRLKEDGGPVHPVSVVVDNARVEHDGMRLRDYFAAAALPAVLASVGHLGYPPKEPHTEAARTAYAIADAMLAAGKVGP